MSNITEKNNNPRHIGFIVDGNRRWARERNLPTLEGHKEGLKRVEDVMDYLADEHIEFATFYLFSTENWSRSQEEVSYLMALASARIASLGKRAKERGFRVVFLSTDNGKLSSSLEEKFKQVEKDTKNGTNGTFCLAFNYGGKEEIADACKQISLENGEFTKENIEAHLYHPEVPPVDLIVRTSGEFRLSGFMLWRSAYSEYIFLQKFWPSLEKEDIKNILKEYQNRSRRFGK